MERVGKMKSGGEWRREVRESAIESGGEGRER